MVGMQTWGRSGLQRLPVRVLGLVLLTAVSSLGLFSLLHALPGDPVSRLMFQEASSSPEEVVRLRRLSGLDQPILVRYGCWLVGGNREESAPDRCAGWPTGGVLRGDLGYSRQYKLPVSTLLLPRLWASLSLMVPGLLLGLLGGVVFGLMAARCGGALDLLIRVLGVLGLAAPIHWVGLMLIYVFAVELGWLPSGGRGGFGHAILPVVALSTFYFARFSRFVRSAALEVLAAPFVAVLRTRGVPENRLWWAHVLPHALLPLVAIVGHALPGLFSGSLIIERVFSVPGVGVLFFESLENDDPMVAMAVGMLLLLASFAATSLVELAYFVLDPRTRRALSEGRLS